MACAVRADGGADGRAAGGGIHPGAETSSLPLRPPGTAAGAHQPGRGNGVAGEYDEWGNLLGETSAQHLQQPYRLPGQQYDEESGLYYNRHRYYDPLQGRYITQDPIGLEGGLNPYQYPLNPIEHIDPLGLANVTPQMIFGTNYYNTMQGANVGFAPNLSDEEKFKALDDFSSMRGVYNPLDDYVKGWALLPPVIAGVVFTEPVASAAALEGGTLTWGR